MHQETVDVALGQFARMSAIVKHEEAANPVEVGFFGAAAVVSGAQVFYDVVVEPWLRLPSEQPQWRLTICAGGFDDV